VERLWGERRDAPVSVVKREINVLNPGQGLRCRLIEVHDRTVLI